jgi:hypothetical protein
MEAVCHTADRSLSRWRPQAEKGRGGASLRKRRKRGEVYWRAPQPFTKRRTAILPVQPP